MISGSKENQAQTARMLTTSLFYPLQLTFSSVTHITNIFSENNRLKMEVAQMSVKIAQLQEQAAENERLRGLLNFSSDFTYSLYPVRVIARDPSLAFRSVVINAGKKDSISRWMPVVGEKGVVGKVVQVMNGLSLVQLIKDPANRTSVMSKRTRTVSILETENGSDFFMKCREHEDFEIGDTIITSGLGGIYPKGLCVGIVQKVVDTQDPLFNKVYLKLNIDFDHIEELFVVRLSPQWSAFRAELDSVEF
ncbi:MAG: rod shape-determining protein MreC [Fibrobacter sp.]|nr:rod shape-determining protein MreC [Fibrobacter sp.]